MVPSGTVKASPQKGGIQVRSTSGVLLQSTRDTGPEQDLMLKSVWYLSIKFYRKVSTLTS